VIAGALMVVWGSSTLLAALGVPIRSTIAPRALQATLTSLLVRFRNESPTVRGAATGLLTTLLPCGWLYVFVATAGGTGHVLDAMLIMFVFWLGTLPMMVALGATIRGVAGAFGRRLPALTCVALMGMGLFTLVHRARLDPVALAGRIAATSPQHATDQTQLPCCKASTHDR